jgi:error-prone DNA polymerase
MRADLPRELLRSSDLEGVEDGATVAVAGMVVARQRPETAKGIVFMLLEDELGTVNLVVPKAVYERCRAAVRAAPLVRARGRLERHEGVTNVVVSEVVELSIPKASARRGRDGEAPEGQRLVTPPMPSRQRGAPHRQLRERAVAELRAVAPGAHSWGRR